MPHAVNCQSVSIASQGRRVFVIITTTTPRLRRSDPPQTEHRRLHPRHLSAQMLGQGRQKVHPLLSWQVPVAQHPQTLRRRGPRRPLSPPQRSQLPCRLLICEDLAKDAAVS